MKSISNGVIEPPLAAYELDSVAVAVHWSVAPAARVVSTVVGVVPRASRVTGVAVVVPHATFKVTSVGGIAEPVKTVGVDIVIACAVDPVLVMQKLNGADAAPPGTNPVMDIPVCVWAEPTQLVLPTPIAKDELAAVSWLFTKST